MKELYTKPELHLQRFTLTQSVASGCGAAHNSVWGGPNHWSKTSCGWKWPDGEVAFLESMDVCTDTYLPDDDVDGICYNNPDGSVSIFGSY